MNLKPLLLVGLLMPLFAMSQVTKNDSVLLFFLGGQSNMSGFGKNTELPDSLNKVFSNVWIYQGNPVGDENLNGGDGIWDNLKPGHGNGFRSDGTVNALSGKFGVELSFAKKLQELYPNEQIAIIKYAKGGSSIDTVAARTFGCWDPDYVGIKGINQYDHFLKTLRSAMNNSDINNNGSVDVLIPSGIIWMQGESDAMYEDVALRYYDNLKRLMDLIRASFRVDDLPVVIGKISDSGQDNNGKTWKYGELVQYAQEKYADMDKNASIVRDTKYYNFSDPYHYDSAAYIDFGYKFAIEIFNLNN